MPATNTSVNLQGFRSWFNDTQYLLLDKIEQMVDDVANTLLGELVDGSSSDTISVTGRDNSGFAFTKAESGKINRVAPVQEDQLSKGFITFGETQTFSWESIVHDKYRFAEEQPTELVTKVQEAISLFFMHHLWNFHTSTTITMPGTGGSYASVLPNGQPLISASQSGPGYSSKTNIGGTGALSIPALTANIDVGNQNIVTSKGIAIPYAPNTLIVPNVQAMIEKGMQITKSDRVESSRNWAINVYSGGAMKLVVLKYAPRLAGGGYDTAAASLYKWGTADADMLKKALKYKWASRPQLLKQFMDPENADSYFSVLARIAVVAQRWQGIVVNQATTAPVTSA